jgi:hypothetical protein
MLRSPVRGWHRTDDVHLTRVADIEAIARIKGKGFAWEDLRLRGGRCAWRIRTADWLRARVAAQTKSHAR